MNPALRLAQAASFYQGTLRRYGRAELSFLRWEISRGVMTASPWWQAVNDRLLRDKADMTPFWQEFRQTSSPATWYRAHNHSIASGYLEHEALARQELPAERLMINVALIRVLFAHAMVARPALALGRLRRLGPLLGDPRRGSVKLFLDLHHSFPPHYPLTGLTAEDMFAAEGTSARMLDFGIILPRLTELYRFAAVDLELPRLAELVSDNAPRYAGLDLDPAHWTGTGPLVRLAARLTGAARTSPAPRRPSSR
ncbi:hypothetical protein AB0B45_31795 [Nonomuraea sp. NPDC049152]|uniref:hypothetical protein n=1 Tax=Nonomuraea sp. NPDC049152 TaxID=3154350 RepID=UPI00340CC53F